MKRLAYFILFVLWAIYDTEGSAVGSRSVKSKDLLGAKECTWGPSYWCSNLTAASGCRAVKHCIQTVWEHQTVPEDSDSICDVCLDMVKQARDQLLSNETEDEIKQVFEGSCKLIPIKIVSKECCKIADDFIPELVDTLASEMNPQTVCSVAGLCNSARIDKLLEQYNAEKPKVDKCQNCQVVVDVLDKRFRKMSQDEVLQSLLRMCSRMGSFSDACSNIVVTYFNEIYQHLQMNLNPQGICFLGGECSDQFHRHVEITPLSNVGFVPVGKENDDLVCEFCEQLVSHLRDLLVANTTEAEFRRVLNGLCNQTGQFSKECTAIVDEYYLVAYDFLVSELNGTILCQMLTICPQSSDIENAPIVPLLPVQSATKAYNLLHDNEDDLASVNLENSGLSVKILSKPEHVQLPIERLFPQVPEKYNPQVCIFCQYFLHYLQTAITDPITEESIKKEIDKACTALPASINDTCIAFVDTYSDALVALLAQEVDPSVICPLIRACPSEDADSVEIFHEENVKGDNCPLCLFAVTQLEDFVKSNKTEANVRAALDGLCTHLSRKLVVECQNFVDTYTETLVKMIVDDLKPQQICVYINMCKDTPAKKPLHPFLPEDPDVDIMSNEIPDFTVNGQLVSKKPVQNKEECVLCEFAMDKIQKILENKTTEDEIENAVLSICNYLPKSVRSECTAFVEKYSDILIKLMVASVEPKEICTYIGLCEKLSERFENAMIIDIPADDIGSVGLLGSPQCTVCKLILSQVEKYIVGPATKEEVIEDLYKVCDELPQKDVQSCDNFVGKYGDAIANMIVASMQPSEICSILMFCDDVKKTMEEEINDCSLCEAIYFHYNYLQQSSDKIVPEQVCNPISEKYVKRCFNMFEKHAFAINMYSSSNEDTTTVCQELDYCKGKSPYVRVSH